MRSYKPEKLIFGVYSKLSRNELRILPFQDVQVSFVGL